MPRSALPADILVQGNKGAKQTKPEPTVAVPCFTEQIIEVVGHIASIGPIIIIACMVL